MTETIRIDLDEVKVHRNAGEYHFKGRARSSLGHEVVGHGPNLTNLVAILREENPHFEGLLEVYRGDTLCFNPMPLKTAFCKGPMPKQFRKEASE